MSHGRQYDVRKFERVCDEIDWQRAYSDDDLIGAFLPDLKESLNFISWMSSSERAEHLTARAITLIRQLQFHRVDDGLAIGKSLAEFALILRVSHPMPLGSFRGIPFRVRPEGGMMEVKDMVPAWRKMSESDGDGELATSCYFCITQCSLENGSGRHNPGIPLEDKRAGIKSGTRKTSGESNSSKDSGDMSGTGPPLQNDATHSPLSTIAMTARPEDQLHLKRRKTTSSKPDGTELDTVISQPFFYLGTVNGPYPDGSYIAAISLHDRSLWLVYNAWNSFPYIDDSEDDEEFIPYDQAVEDARERPYWFRPDISPDWASFPGLSGKTLMAKLADDVRTWSFDDAHPFCMSSVWTGQGDVVPAFVCARRTEKAPKATVKRLKYMP
ncbi:MAG: hypothetical protein M1826_005103 [Phylliscum demangeonii]|nr:MAG: hypothetical protein M1826_005103 [Phylliscum demangeonii]